jgi:hypothetical protein
MVFPLWLVPVIGPGCLVFGSIVNAAADGKRLRAIDALETSVKRRENRLVARAGGPVNQPAWFRF